VRPLKYGEPPQEDGYPMRHEASNKPHYNPGPKEKNPPPAEYQAIRATSACGSFFSSGVSATTDGPWE
jgi:hypothetical protein